MENFLIEVALTCSEVVRVAITRDKTCIIARSHSGVQKEDTLRDLPKVYGLKATMDAFAAAHKDGRLQAVLDIGELEARTVCHVHDMMCSFGHVSCTW